MNEEDLVAYGRVLRRQNADRRALWAILQELVGRYAKATDEPKTILDNFAECVAWRLEQKDEGAAEQGLELVLADTKASADRFFSELSRWNARGDL